ncbi:hypothetical protein NHX12_005233 [Muraenolepis orangiensis]|uniref:Uncharacterized protein n=1 Tax=Muraenolepis orangiensis TaxID=630683 RepID=A0A9Q0DTL1_9TELE|nr:hypothetical protein NHX12_005233 [Muraenolepis orangiensis]
MAEGSASFQAQTRTLSDTGNHRNPFSENSKPCISWRTAGTQWSVQTAGMERWTGDVQVVSGGLLSGEWIGSHSSGDPVNTATVYRLKRESQTDLKSLYCSGRFSDACPYDLTIVLA